MASKITIKRSLTAAAPAGLSFGEMALVQGSGLTANQLYVGISGGSPVWVGAKIENAGTWTDTAAQTSLATQYAIEQRIGVKISAQTAGVSSFNGLTGAVTGVSSFNGLTGAVGGVTTSVANTFTQLNTFSAGISASGGTFTSDIKVNSLTVGRGSGGIASNVAVGQSALATNTTAQNNTAVGQNALQSNTDGGSNTAVGSSALPSNTTGSQNVAVGLQALYQNTTGANNFAGGYGALYYNTTGTNNVAVGQAALNYNTTGTNKTAIGYAAGQFRGTESDTHTTGTGGIYIGYQARGSANGQTNEIVIGVDALGLGSNTAVIGATTQSAATIYGVLNLPKGLSASGATFTGNISAPNIVSSFNGITGAVTGVASFNGLTGAVGGVTTSVANTFTALQTFSTGISTSGGTFGTPTQLVGTNITGTASGLTAGNVTTNANLTGAITSTGNATVLGTSSFSSANLLSALSDKTGSGFNVFGTSPTISNSLIAGGVSFDLLNTTATTVNFAGAATTLNLGAAGGTATFAGSVIVNGDFTVQGNTTTLNTSTLNVEDFNITMGLTLTSAALSTGAGIAIGVGTGISFAYDHSTSAGWLSSVNIDLASAKEYRIGGTRVLNSSALGAGVTGSSLTQVGIITGGTWNGSAITDIYLAQITTAGKVANSATTATSLNTASTIVARDALGGFTAGTINAALIGNASTATTAATVTTAAQPNITSVGTLTGLTVSNPISGSVTGSAATVTTAAQPNITSVGTLTGLTVSNPISGSITGNAATATTATTATNIVATEQTTGTIYLVGVAGATSSTGLLVNASPAGSLEYNVATGELVAGLIDGGTF